MTTDAAKNRSSRLAAPAAAVWLLVAMFANLQIEVQSAEGNQQQPNFMGPFPDGFNNLAPNEVQPTINQMPNSLMGNTGTGPVRPMPSPPQQQQQQSMAQGNNGKSPAQGNNQPPTSNIGPLQMQNMRPPQVSNNGSPLVQNNGPPSSQNNGFPPMQGNGSPSVQGSPPQEQKFGVNDQAQRPQFAPSGSQQGTNPPLNPNRPQGTNFNPSPTQNNAQQLRPPQEVSFTNKVPATNVQEQVPQQFQQKYPQQNQQQFPSQSFSQQRPQQMPAQKIPQQQSVASVPQQQPMASVPQQQPIASVQQQQQPQQQPQLSSYYSYTEIPTGQQSYGGPQPPSYPMPYQAQGSMNYPSTGYNGQVQSYSTSYQAQPSNIPSNTGQMPQLPMMNLGNMLPMESLSALNPMPMAQQSIGAVSGAVGGVVDKVHGYATGLQEGLTGMALDIGTKLVDGGQAAMHTIADVAMALPDSLLNAKRKMLNGLRGSPQSQSNTMGGAYYPQQIPQGNNNNNNNNYMMPRPPYTSGNVQSPQQQQPFQVQPQQLQQQQQPMIRIMPNEQNPVNGPQPINRYMVSPNNAQ